MPQNFGRLVWCTSPSHLPELVPGLQATETRFKLDELFDSARRDELITKVFFGPALLIWFLPGWLYRVSIKSTFWVWWPLAFIGARPVFARDPQFFAEEINQDAMRRVTRIIAWLTILGFLGFNLYTYLERRDWSLPVDMPAAVLLFSMLDVKHPIGEWIAFGSACLTLAISLWIGRAYRAWRSAHRLGNNEAIARAERQFPYIEGLWRAGFLLGMISSCILLFGLALALNARDCYVPNPPERVMEVAHWLYGARTPPLPQCKSA